MPNSFEELPANVQAAFMRQEHRLVVILRNLRRTQKYPESDERHEAARDALIYRIALAFMPAGMSGVGIASIVALLIALDANKAMRQQTRLMAEIHERDLQQERVKGLLQRRLIDSRLSLWNSQVTDSDISALANSISAQEDVTELDLRETSITDEAAKSLSEMPMLRSLDLTGTGISDEGLSYIGRITSLEQLRIHGCRITDAGISQLTGLTNLKSLDIARTNVTNNCVKDLNKMKQLEEIHLDFTKIDESGMMQLQQGRTTQRVYRESENFLRHIKELRKPRELSDPDNGFSEDDLLLEDLR